MLVNFSSNFTANLNGQNIKRDKLQKYSENNKSSIPSNNIPQETLQAYNNISFRSVSNIDLNGDYYTGVKKVLANVNPKETISIEDAIEVLKPLQLTEKKLSEALLACSYDTHNTEVLINKNAVYKYVDLYINLDKNKTLTAKIIATSLDNEAMAFSDDKLKSLYNSRGELSLRVKNKLKPLLRDTGYPSAREMTLAHKSVIYDAIGRNYKQDTSVQLTQNDYYKALQIDLEKEKNDMKIKLQRIKQDFPALSDELYNRMMSELDNDNVNIKKVYDDYYSLLKDCKTLDDVRELYPEIPIPNHNFVDNGNLKLVETRLAGENFDKVGLDIIKKIYVENIAPTEIIVPLENNPPTLYSAMAKRGIDFGTNPAELKALYRKSEELVGEIKNIDKLPDKDIEKYMKHQAIKKSRIWAEMIGYTNKYWHPVRAIAYRFKHPETSFYKLDKLVDGYLFELFERKETIHSDNPLAEYVDGKPFNKNKKAELERVYYSYKNNLDYRMHSQEFKDFKSSFDLEAMRDSLVKLEKHYKNTFAKLFVTPERKQRYLDELEKAYDLLFEKLELSKQLHDIDKKKITEKIINQTEEGLIDSITEIEVGENSLVRASFNKIKQAIQSCDNADLKDMFKRYIGSEDADIDVDNFMKHKEVFESEIIDGKVRNEYKLLAHFKIEEQYITDMLENKIPENMSLEEYTTKIENKYRVLSNGNINYYGMVDDITNRKVYETLVNRKFNFPEEKEIFRVLEEKFVSSKNPDYTSAVHVISMYDEVPENLKTNYAKLILNSSKIEKNNFLECLRENYNMIMSWNMDKPEFVIMDADKIPQKVVITSEAKKEVWEECKNNMETFDVLIKKFFGAAEQRVGSHHGQGIKAFTSNNKELLKKFAAELKIQGSKSVGEKRLYARIPNAEDIAKYGNVKYVFFTLKKHL